MQISLIPWIDQFHAALSEPEGLASFHGTFLDHEKQLMFRACAELVGISSHVLVEHANGMTSVDPQTATQVRNQLIAAKRALLALPEGGSAKPYLIEEFAIDPSAVLADPVQTPEIEQLLRGTYMMAVSKDNRNAYKTLTTTLSTREEAMSAIALLRPDIAQALRDRMAELKLDANAPGILPATPKQIRDLQVSYRALAKHFEAGHSQADAQQALEKIRADFPVKQPKPRAEKPAPVISRITPDGRKLMVLSQRPRADSVNEFLLPLEQLEPLRDTLKRVSHAQDARNDGSQERIRRNSGECWLDYSDRLHLVARARNLTELLERNLEELEEKYPGTLEALDRVECVTVYPMRDSKKDCVVRQKLSQAHETPELADELRDAVIQHQASLHLSLPMELLAPLAYEENALRDRTSTIKTQFEEAIALHGEARSEATANAQQALAKVLADYDAVLPQKFTAAVRQQAPANNAYSK